MRFKQVVSGKKFVIVAAMLVLLSGFGLGTYAKGLEWNFDDIPEKWGFELEVPNPKSSKETVSISGFFWAKNVLEELHDAYWEDIIKARDHYQKINEQYGINANSLAIQIYQTSEKSFPFDLKKFALTQGISQYGLGSHFNIEPYNSTLRVATYWKPMYRTHYLRPGVTGEGFLQLPDTIDLSKSFTIWYGDYSAELNAEGLDVEERSDWLN